MSHSALNSTFLTSDQFSKMSNVDSQAAPQADFALNLLRTACDPTENAFMSPMSISVALAMTYLGAADSTKQQINHIVFKGLSDTQVHSAMSELVSVLGSQKGEGHQLSMANRIYSQQGFELVDEYKAAMKKQYDSELLLVDFASNAAAVAIEVNRWVEERTNNRIKDLLSPDSMDALTRIVLVNALYFKGTWADQFRKRFTKQEKFYCSKDKEITVDMMHQEEYFEYFKDNHVQVLGLPYQERDLLMLILLPKEKFGLAEFEKCLTGPKLLEYIKNMMRENIELSLPKFKFEQKFELKPALTQMGMGDMFSRQADFTAMAKNIGKGDLYVSNVVHKAFVEVNEEGTEAAAATGAKMMLCCMPPTPIPLIVDHPFLFAIVHKSRDLLFIGHMYEPK